jgi:hypothetical protein
MENKSTRETDGEIVPTVIDFTKMKDEDGNISESWILTFGAALRWLMPSLYRGSTLPLSIRGTKNELTSFANVLSKEKRYLQSWKSSGLDSPVTHKSKGKLSTAIAKFQRSTGLKWPFKQG